jgi:hypothetical protein
MTPFGLMATARAWRGVQRAALAAFALAAVACGRAAEPPTAWPEGALLVARAPALDALLERLARVEATPLAREARAWRAALPACAVLEAHALQAGLDALRSSLRCADPSGPLASVHRARGAHDLVFAWPAAGAQVRGSASLTPTGELEVRVSLPGAAFEGPRALLRPAALAPGAPVLGGADALVHARLRAEGGIDLPALLPQGSQGDELFALRSRLFGAAVLDGTWELALYLPGEGEAIPRVALALGVRHQDMSEAAAASFLDELEGRWPVRRRAFTLGDAAGACLPELRVLPGLAPCYVTTARALVVGWNEASLRKALDGSPPALSDAGGLVAELARLPAADARIAAPLAPAGAPLWPWRRLLAEPRSSDAGIEVRVALEGAGA